MEEPQFTHLLQSNDAPPEDTVREVTNFLAGPWQDLAYVDDEIQRLWELLDQAQWQRNQTVDFINTYNVILSPIRRIPTDILHEIFSYCPTTHRNPVMSTKEAPLILTQICRSWRSVALSCPCIWARIHTPGAFDEDEFQAHGLPCYETMQMRCEHIQTWLSRSATFPISVSIDYPYSRWDPSDRQTSWEEKIVKRLFETLSPFAPRWKDVEIRLPADLHPHLEALIPVENLPNLRNLKISAEGRRISGL
ncbi:hypothetical protein M413DRAFT_37267, partial [Hebeloma cylindrosporum]